MSCPSSARYLRQHRAALAWALLCCLSFAVFLVCTSVLPAAVREVLRWFERV